MNSLLWKEPIEVPVYFCGCNDCEWESDDTSTYRCEVEFPECCPKCGSDNLKLKKDWIMQ
jgi:Zn finger protein HypA/HybF involved in hydrogenase expression